MAKTSGINSTGNSRKAGANKQEIRADVHYQYTYTYETVVKLIRNKALIISDRDNGSYNSCELLIDLERIEQEYLTAEQRRIIQYKYVYMYTNVEIGELIHIDRRTVSKIILDIESTLSEALTHEI